MGISLYLVCVGMTIYYMGIPLYLVCVGMTIYGHDSENIWCSLFVFFCLVLTCHQIRSLRYDSLVVSLEFSYHKKFVCSYYERISFGALKLAVTDIFVLLMAEPSVPFLSTISPTISIIRTYSYFKCYSEKLASISNKHEVCPISLI